MRVLPRLPVSAALGATRTGLAGGGLPSGPPRARACHPGTRTASPGGQRRGLGVAGTPTRRYNTPMDCRCAGGL